jgi:hypothetical protein
MRDGTLFTFSIEPGVGMFLRIEASRYLSAHAVGPWRQKHMKNASKRAKKWKTDEKRKKIGLRPSEIQYLLAYVRPNQGDWLIMRRT